MLGAGSRPGQRKYPRIGHSVSNGASMLMSYPEYGPLTGPVLVGGETEDGRLGYRFALNNSSVRRISFDGQLTMTKESSTLAEGVDLLFGRARNEITLQLDLRSIWRWDVEGCAHVASLLREMGDPVQVLLPASSPAEPGLTGHLLRYLDASGFQWQSERDEEFGYDVLRLSPKRGRKRTTRKRSSPTRRSSSQ